MTVAILMPTGITDEWRGRAREYVARWYGLHFPAAELHYGECASAEWSKGEAIDAALATSSADTLVLADADSFMFDAEDLRAAIALVETAGHPYAVPHSKVYRLRADETGRIEAAPDLGPRLGYTVRPVYEGPVGGGITVVSRAAFELVNGIDRRFLGWGGEDLAFGWALQTLAGPGPRLLGRLVHLWHPHPAPTLRGSPASEQLVAVYKSARGVRRRMAAVVAGEQWSPSEPIATPIRFRMTANRSTLRLPCGDLVKFRDRYYETTDPDEIEQLRTFTIVREEHRR